MEVDIEEDENEPELTYPYEEVDPLNPPPPASDSEPKDVIDIEDMVEPEDETVPASVHEVVRSSVEEGTTAMKNLVRKLGNAEEKAVCKKLKKELEEARFRNTLLHTQNERVKRDLYWTRVQAHEFYREMIRRGFVFEERPNEAIDVLVEDEESPSSEPWGSFRDSCCRFGVNDYKKSSFARYCLLTRAWNAKAGIMLVDLDSYEVKLLPPVLAIESYGVGLRENGMTFGDKGPRSCQQMGGLEDEKLMTAEFCPTEELQRMENELWNLKVKEYNMVAYTQRFNELAF
ncbi:hypothetical protein Tco_0140902 [Tanacetum coccineum]